MALGGAGGSRRRGFVQDAVIGKQLRRDLFFENGERVNNGIVFHGGRRGWRMWLGSRYRIPELSGRWPFLALRHSTLRQHVAVPASLSRTATSEWPSLVFGRVASLADSVLLRRYRQFRVGGDRISVSASPPPRAMATIIDLDAFARDLSMLYTSKRSGSKQRCEESATFVWKMRILPKGTFLC